MGTDIYMRWDDITKEDIDRQRTGWVPTGEVGYMRASIHSSRELALFRTIFGDGSMIHFDFANNTNKLEAAISDYLAGVPQKLSKGDKLLMGLGAHLAEALSDQGLPIVPGHIGNENNEFFVDELRKFYKLGFELEQHGKNPYIKVT